MVVELDSFGSEERPAVCSCKHGSEVMVFVKYGEFLEWVLKDSALWS
jgi:hypothetical protein